MFKILTLSASLPLASALITQQMLACQITGNTIDIFT
ncbi:hypothetical protein NEOC95_001678 [Neochlamydia sp. AcF95]|nr:hypothetical protein [Neochlamydia sp. AcF95]